MKGPISCNTHTRMLFYCQNIFWHKNLSHGCKMGKENLVLPCNKMLLMLISLASGLIVVGVAQVSTAFLH